MECSMPTDYDALFARKCELQSAVLRSWDRLHAMQQEHNKLRSELDAVRHRLESGDLFDELFADPQS